MTKKNIAATVGIDGEKEFKQAITSINSDMKVLASEMKKVTSEFVDNAKSVEALTAKDKVLNEQVDKQKDKIEELRKAMENSKEQYPDNSKKLNEWKTSLNAAEAKLFDLTHEVDTNKKALEEAKNPTVQLATEVTDLGQAAEKAGGHTLKMGDIIKANLISAAIINGIKQLAGAIKDIATQSITAADEIATLAGQTGFTAEEIQKWQYVGKGLDVELETITGSLVKLTRNMNIANLAGGSTADTFKTVVPNANDVQIATLKVAAAQEKLNELQLGGKATTSQLTSAQANLLTAQNNLNKASTSTTVKLDGKEASGAALAFEKLGVKVADSSGQLRDSKVVMGEAINALGGMKNETERDALAMQIFGKSAMEMNPLIKAGSAEIERLTIAAEKNGAIMSNATIEGLDKFKDSTEMLGQEVQAMAGELMVELMPAFNELIQWFRDNKGEIKEFAEKAVGAVADGLEWLIDNKQSVVDGLGLILGGFIAFKTLEGINLLIGTFNLLLAANTIGLVVIAIAGLVLALAGLIIYWDDIADAIHNAFDWLNKYLGVDQTKKGNASMQTGVYTSSATQSGYSVAREFVPKAAKPLVDWNAEGAIFTRPTIFNTLNGYQGFGEAGPEVAMPLSNLAGIMADSFDYDRLAQANRKGMIGLTVQFDNDVVGKIVDARLIPLM